MDRDRLSFLGALLPPAFERRMVSIAPGARLAYEAADWLGALVVVEGGEVELEGMCGSRRRFGSGDVLWLAGLPLRALHNAGCEPALLSAVTRRHDAAGAVRSTNTPTTRTVAYDERGDD
jgi:hypothetical protein